MCERSVSAMISTSEVQQASHAHRGSEQLSDGSKGMTVTNMRAMTARTLTGAACVLALGLLTGCGAIQSIASIPGISADTDGGSITLNDGDGGSAKIDIDSNGELPEWLPSEFPLPDTYEVVAVTAFVDEGESFKSLMLSSTGDFDKLIASIDDGLAAASLTPETRQVGQLGETKNAMYAVTMGAEDWLISVLDYGSDGAEGAEIRVSYATLAE